MQLCFPFLLTLSYCSPLSSFISCLFSSPLSCRSAALLRLYYWRAWKNITSFLTIYSHILPQSQPTLFQTHCWMPSRFGFSTL
jgi:hypothetical protein